MALTPDQVKHLALEGGGGKGLAFIGSLMALHMLKGLKPSQPLDVVQCAGSSAGAITALLVALRYTPIQMAKYMQTTNFERFFDPPTPRKVPAVGQSYPSVPTSWVEDAVRQVLSVSGLRALVELVRGGSEPGSLTAKLIAAELPSVGRRLPALQAAAGKEPLRGLLRSWAQVFSFLPADMGIYSGEAARSEFERLIVNAVQKRYPGATRAGTAGPTNVITFADLATLMPECKLVLTGSNLSTGRTELFSNEHTPNFPVADAVRISMSLPFIYKPYVITGARDGFPPCGTYVDGGLWNNLPLVLRGTPLGSTLGIRLEVVPAVPVIDLGELLARLAGFGLFGTGESQVLGDYTDHTLLLDSEGLSLVDFNPDPDVLARVNFRAVRDTYSAFGQTPPSFARDPADARDSKRRRTGDGGVCQARWP